MPEPRTIKPRNAAEQERKLARRQRARERQSRIVSHRSVDFEEAENWDLAYWQAQTPQDRLAALVAIRQDVEKAEQAKRAHEQHR